MIACLTLNLFASHVYAETLTVNLPGVNANHSVTLHVYKEVGMTQIKGVTILPATDVRDAAVQFESELVGDKSFFLVAEGSNGEIHTTSVLSSSMLQPIDACDDKASSIHNPEEQATLVKALVTIRERYYTTARSRLQQLLTLETIADLQRLEGLFGLSKQGDLSPDAEPIELASRINRLVEAVRNYQASRK